MVDVDTGYLGPRPELLDFPSHDASTALDAATSLIEQLQSCQIKHRDAADLARKDFEGQTRKAFDQAFDQAMGEIDQKHQLLAADAYDLDHLIRGAKTGIDRRNDEIADWEQKAYWASVGQS